MSAPVTTLPGRESLASEIAGTLAEVEGPRPFPVVRVLEGEAPASPAVHVDGLLLDQEENLWSGHGGSAKSVLALTTAVCTPLGLPVFGTLGVHRSGPVLLILPEDGVSATRMMLDAIVEGLALDTDARRTLTEQLIMVEDDANVNLTKNTARIGATALACGAVLVVLDPLSNLIAGASEREEDVATAVCAAIRRDVCRGAGATVLLTHHLRKPSREGGLDAAASIHDTRGSGGWANSSRLVFGVAKKCERITMTGLKTNRLKAGLRHELDLAIVADPANPAHWLSCRVTDANAGARSDALTPGIGRALNANETKALLALDDRHEPGARFSNSRWHGESGIVSPETFRGVKDRLLDAGLAIAEPTGRMNPNGKTRISQYGITDRGRGALNTGWTSEGVKL